MDNHISLNKEYAININELRKLKYNKQEMYRAIKQRSKELQSTPVRWEDYYD